jgi:peptide/nickel transport system substrate-binding protein
VRTGAAAPTGKVTIGWPVVGLKRADPGLVSNASDLNYFWPAMDGLTWLNAKGDLQPGLAKSWKNVSDLVWEFTLGDYKFHNGRAVTSQDVADTFKRYFDPANKLTIGGILNSISKVDAVDPKTVRVTTKAPDPTLLRTIALGMILPMAELTSQGDKFFDAPIGTGPFRFTSANFSPGEGPKYTAMGADWVSPRGVPKQKDLDYRFIVEDPIRAAAFKSGELDVTENITFDAALDLWKQGYGQMRIVRDGTRSFAMDLTQGPFTDKRVRQAVNYAVNTEKMISNLQAGMANHDGQLLGTTALGYNPDVKPYPYDPAKAKQLLAAAGYGNGFKIPLLFTAIFDKSWAEAVAADLAAVGIQTDIQVLEAAVWVQSILGPWAKRPGLTVSAINWDTSFEAYTVYRFYSSDVPPDQGGKWNNPDFEKIYQQAKVTLDADKRTALWQQAAKLINDEAPVLFQWQHSIVGATQKNVAIQPSWDASVPIVGMEKKA